MMEARVNSNIFDLNLKVTKNALLRLPKEEGKNQDIIFDRIVTFLPFIFFQIE